MNTISLCVVNFYKANAKTITNWNWMTTLKSMLQKKSTLQKATLITWVLFVNTGIKIPIVSYTTESNTKISNVVFAMFSESGGFSFHLWETGEFYQSILCLKDEYEEKLFWSQSAGNNNYYRMKGIGSFAIFQNNVNDRKRGSSKTSGVITCSTKLSK